MKILKPIAIIGIMGAGKTLLGKKLAQKLKRDLVDIDKEIKIKTDLSVKDYIVQNKEEELNEVEFQIIKKYVAKKYVISTGDHTINNQKAWDYILHHTLTIWINPDLDKIFERLRPTEHRPYFEENLTIDELKELYKKRERRYKHAHIELNEINFKNLNNLLSIFD